MSKAGRNDPCPCGSGKKFKKCCQNKMIGKKFLAEKVSSPIHQVSKMTSLFQNQMIARKEFHERTFQNLSALSVKPQSEATNPIQAQQQEEKRS